MNEEQLFAKTVGKLAYINKVEDSQVDCIISHTAQQMGVFNDKTIKTVKVRIKKAFPEMFRR